LWVEWRVNCMQAGETLPEVDLMVCDMNYHPEQAVKVCASMLSRLKRGGVLLMTMKFFGTVRRRCLANCIFGLWSLSHILG
jgi:hypothetical protein